MIANDNHALSQDDKASLDDIAEVEIALMEARHALTKAMTGLGGRSEREEFVYKIGFARGRLARVSSRIYGERADAL
jgi:hypothetical protein